ncbi:hypothetical protein BG006_010493, partial [Podila minutissima]
SALDVHDLSDADGNLIEDEVLLSVLPVLILIKYGISSRTGKIPALDTLEVLWGRDSDGSGCLSRQYYPTCQ